MVKQETINKFKLGIFDFTDCEGCQVKIVSLGENLLKLEKRFEIVNWRLGQEKKEWGQLDVAIIEGTPITEEEINILKYLRENSKYLIGLGSCATLGGIPGIIDKKSRKKWYKKIYNKEYKPRGIDAVPLTTYATMDFLIHGCPINNKELIRVIEEILSGRKPAYRGYSVCYECKLAGNKCRLLDKKPCLGPITQGGCDAICISGGSPCYGCFGLREDANNKALLKILNNITDKKEIKRYFSMFLSRQK